MAFPTAEMGFMFLILGGNPAVGISLMSSTCVTHAAPACAIRLFPLALGSLCSAQMQP